MLQRRLSLIVLEIYIQTMLLQQLEGAFLNSCKCMQDRIAKRVTNGVEIDRIDKLVSIVQQSFKPGRHHLVWCFSQNIHDRMILWAELPFLVKMDGGAPQFLSYTNEEVEMYLKVSF